VLTLEEPSTIDWIAGFGRDEVQPQQAVQASPQACKIKFSF